MAKRLIQGPAAPVWLVDADGNPADSDHPFQVEVIGIEDGWEVVQLEDLTSNDSDKYFTVPAGYQYQVLWVYATLTSSGDAGNRRLAVTVWNTLGRELLLVSAGATQAASLTYRYAWGPSLADQAAVRGTTYPNITTPLPSGLFLSAGWQIGVTDYEAIAPLADDMLLQVIVARRAV